MILILLSGCAANKVVAKPNAPVSQSKLTLDKDADIQYMIDAYDPWEGFNRQMYIFNYYFDKYVFLPVVAGYAFVTPDTVEDRITCFYNNLGELKNFTNCLFQLKPKDTGITLGRFLANSTIGIAGFYDPAAYFGWQRRNEDFGQTLGYFGTGAGPYLVLPFFGPSSLRDASGLLVDTSIKSAVYDAALNDAEEKELILAGVNLLNAIDTRHRIAFRYYESGSPFEYELVRRLYLDMRTIEIAK
jgi:phospholipid-binding lipoprotein MlaA